MTVLFYMKLVLLIGAYPVLRFELFQIYYNTDTSIS